MLGFVREAPLRTAIETVREAYVTGKNRNTVGPKLRFHQEEPRIGQRYTAPEDPAC